MNSDINNLEDLTRVAEGATQEGWCMSGTRQKVAGSDTHSILATDDGKEIIVASVWYDPKTHAGFHDAKFIGMASPRAVLSLLEEIRELRGDAERFRALTRCGRIKMQGSAGIDPLTLERNGNNVHFGAEFWPERQDKYPELIEGHDRSTRWGVACLRALAEAILENEARQALADGGEK